MAKSTFRPDKMILRIAILLLIVYLVICALLFFFQTRRLFFPDPQVTETPKTYGLQYEEVNLPTADAGNLNGWWIPAAKPDAPVILYLHGNGANIGANAEQAHRLRELGFSVFLFDYRGYGKSSGLFPAEQRLYEDAEQAWNYLVKTRHVEPKELLIYGHSLGGAIAIETASHHPEVAGLIVESSFTSMLDMTQRVPWTAYFPTNLLLTQRFDSFSKVPNLKMPVLFIHGQVDRTIPYEMSEKNYAVAPQPKQLLLIPNGDHDNDAIMGGKLYLDGFKNFTDKVLANS
jgi:uncharacterized protein